LQARADACASHCEIAATRKPGGFFACAGSQKKLFIFYYFGAARDILDVLHAAGESHAYQLNDLYSTRHAAAIDAFKSVDFPVSGDWKPVIDDARLMVVADGFNVGRHAHPQCHNRPQGARHDV
jgi:hypothetical protein